MIKTILSIAAPLMAAFPNAGLMFVFMFIISGLNLGYNHATFAELDDLSKVSVKIVDLNASVNINHLQTEIAASKRELFGLRRLPDSELTNRDTKHIDNIVIELVEKEDTLKRLKDKLGPI